MKKAIIGLLLGLAIIVIVSPGIIARLAEEHLFENLRLAAAETNGLAISSSGFDRNWFSSAGQHRIELLGGDLRDALALATDAAEGVVPALIIDTRLDHGLIPLASMSRDQGSLAPALGRAVSTLRLDLGDGAPVDLPGAIYSTIGVTGSVRANYVVPAGDHATDDGTLRWESGQFDFSSDPSASHFVFAGNMGAIVLADSDGEMSIAGLTFSADRRQTEYGIAVGDFELRVGEVSATTGDVSLPDLLGLIVVGHSNEALGLIDGATTLTLKDQQIPDFGKISVMADIRFSGLDAAALGSVTRQIDALSDDTDPLQLFAATSADLERLAAAGFKLDLRQLDVTLPMGTVATVMHFEMSESDAATFEWSRLLLGLVASIDLQLPADLVSTAIQLNPEAEMLVGLGYLKKDGDLYTTKLRLKKGLLTVNGAPVPLPFAAFH